MPVTKALVDEAYTAPPDVKAVNPVPPLVVANVPATVTTPVVVVEGVNPVLPNEIDDTLVVDALVAII